MKRILLFLCALTALGVGLASCAPATAAPIDLATALAKPTEVASTVATATAIPTKTPIPAPSTPEATATPEATPTPEVHMTLENWKKVFSGQMTGQDGSNVELNQMFAEDTEIIFTSADANKIEQLPAGTPFTILNPDGKITFYADPSVAAERATAGAIILVSKRTPSPSGIGLAIEAATLQYEKGNTNIYVEFGEVTEKLSSNTGIRIYLESILNSSIVRMPKHFKVAHIYESGEFTLEEAGLNITDPENWLKDLLEAGFTAIVLYAQ